MANLGSFLTSRIGKFNTKRNDPNEEACSDMSPWLHFGQVFMCVCVYMYTRIYVYTYISLYMHIYL